MRTTRTALGALVAAALILAGCSSGKDTVRRPTRADPCAVGNTSDEGGNCNDVPDGKGPIEIRGARRGGTVTVLTHEGLRGTLDPSGASEPDVVSVLSGLVTRSLTQYRYDPVTHQTVLVPDIATDLGVHNENYTEWKYRVRHGIRFEDGTEVRARDVARGVRRCLRSRAFPTSPCPENGPIRSVTSRHNTLTFRFDRPFPDLPYLAAMPALGPVPPGHAADPATYAQHPLATGPYRIERYRRGRSLTLVRNPRWDTRTDAARTQYPDRYVMRAGVPSHHIQGLLLADQGPAQTTLTYDAVDRDPFYRTFRDKRRLVFGPNPCTTYWAPDNRTITDPRVRHALAYAFPYLAVIRAEGLVPNVSAIPATNLLPPFTLDRTAYRLDHRSGFETDPAGARRLLGRAHALGTRVRFTDDPDHAAGRRIRDALVRSLRRSGFDPEPEETPVPGLAQGPGSGRDVDVRLETWCGTWNSGGAWLPALYASGRPANVERFSQPSVDRKLRRVAVLPFQQQAAAWNLLDKQVMQRWVPIVPLWYGGVAMAHGSRIVGMADDTVRGMPTWQQIRVSP